MSLTQKEITNGKIDRTFAGGTSAFRHKPEGIYKETAKYSESTSSKDSMGISHLASEVKHMDSSHTEMQKFFAR